MFAVLISASEVNFKPVKHPIPWKLNRKKEELWEFTHWNDFFFHYSHTPLLFALIRQLSHSFALARKSKWPRFRCVFSSCQIVPQFSIVAKFSRNKILSFAFEEGDCDSTIAFLTINVESRPMLISKTVVDSKTDVLFSL